MGDWQLIGINSSLSDSGDPAEAEQMTWLSAELEATAGWPVLLFKHKPLCLTAFTESDMTADVMSPPSRSRLLDICAAPICAPL